MGSADEGTDIRVKLDEVALQKLQSGDPCLMPCVDCGFVTTYFCDRCWGEDHFPQDKAHGRFIPLCPACDKIAQQSLKVEILVGVDEAHQVNNEQFDVWNANVKDILDVASKQIEMESRKFQKTQKTLKAEMEPYMWRQVRVDTEAQ